MEKNKRNIRQCSASDTAAWQPEPLTRRAFSIISTCFVTLDLCVWTSIHLNLSAHEEGWMRPRLRRMGWMLLGFLEPELVWIWCLRFFSLLYSGGLC